MSNENKMRYDINKKKMNDINQAYDIRRYKIHSQIKDDRFLFSLSLSLNDFNMKKRRHAEQLENL